jgi:hypothetical protein
MSNRFLLISAPAILCASLVFWSGAKAFADHDDSPDFPFIGFDEKAIQYDEAPTHDAVALLEQKLERGEANLDYDPEFGYLPSLLKNLNLPVDSQVLVFSKTSFQAPRISPAKPRAVYFNDHVAIGSVQNGEVFEVMSLDPRQGEIFYTLDMRKTDKPSFDRQGIACLQCHYGAATLNVPGLLVSSVYVRSDGSLLPTAGGLATDHRIPLSDRWGGWYVTSTHGTTQHLGNAVARDPGNPTHLDAGGAGNLMRLDERFDTSRYLTNTSDMVALMTLEHQTRMTNLITRLGWETRIAMDHGGLTGFQKRLDQLTGELVTYMVFADEAPIPEPIEGSSTFTQTFARSGPRDKQGRSLRDFDLRTHLFQYPVSYMIYSEAFESLPPPAKEAVYRKLFEVLTGSAREESFARLSAASRLAALEILRETQPDLPPYWRSTPASQ